MPERCPSRNYGGEDREAGSRPNERKRVRVVTESPQVHSMKLENIEPNIQNSENNIDSLERIRSFEQIKNPEELLEYMKTNIEYGFVGKDDKKVYSPKHEDWGVGESPEQILQSPKELLESGYGTCWEQVELERGWFLKNNYEFKTFLLMFGKEISQKNPAHTLLAYKSKDKWYWFENTLGKNNGIHEFDNLEDLKENAINMLKASASKNGATGEDIKKLKLYEYETPVHSCCGKDEFVSKVAEENRTSVSRE